MATSIPNESLKSPKPSPVQSVERTLDILELLGRSEHELGISEIGEALGLSGGTVHRLLSTLTFRGYARHNPETRKYALGLKAFTMATSARERLGPLALPFLKQLMEVGQETANLASLDRNSAVYVESVQAPRIVRMCPELGKRLPLHSTAVGKVLLAHQPDELVRNVVRGAPLAATTPNTIMDLGRLSEELKRVRQTGYAVDLEEHEEGVRCLAAPVFSPDGRILAAMSLSGPASRLGSERLEVLIPHIKSIAATFSLSLDPFV